MRRGRRGATRERREWRRGRREEDNGSGRPKMQKQNKIAHDE